MEVKERISRPTRSASDKGRGKGAVLSKLY